VEKIMKDRNHMLKFVDPTDVTIGRSENVEVVEGRLRAVRYEIVEGRLRSGNYATFVTTESNRQWTDINLTLIQI
jgi:hypothetical protein